MRVDERFGAKALEAWCRDGGVLIERFFTPDEVAAVRPSLIAFAKAALACEQVHV